MFLLYRKADEKNLQRYAASVHSSLSQGRRPQAKAASNTQEAMATIHVIHNLRRVC
jgi:hypothetical protein